MNEIERAIYGSGLSGYLARARMIKAIQARLYCAWCGKRCKNPMPSVRP